MSLTFNDIKKWKLMPIHQIILSVPDETVGPTITFEQFRKGSKWDLNAVTDTDDNGFQRVVAYEFNGEFLPVQNDLNAMTPAINAVNQNGITDFDLFLQGPSNMVGKSGGWIGTNGTVNGQPLKLSKWNAKMTMTQDGLYPVLTIAVQGLFSKDLFEMINAKFLNINPWEG